MTSHQAGGGEVTSVGRRKQNTSYYDYVYNMKFVAVDTYDIVNVGLRSQMAALKCFTACEQLAVESAIFHFFD